MSIRPLLRVLAASAFLLLPAAPSGAEKVPPPSPATASKSVKTEIAKARALMKLRRYDLALGVLRPLVQDPRHRDSILFLTGIAALEHSQKKGREAKSRDTLLSEAIAYFRTMLIRNPGLVRVRLELARAFFLKGEDDLARRHFEQVLAGKPPAQVVVNVNRFLGQIRARKRWGLPGRHGAHPGQQSRRRRSDEQIIYIQGLPFRRRPAGDHASSGIGLSAWAGGEYEYPLEERWRLRAGANISRREYSKNRVSSRHERLGPSRPALADRPGIARRACCRRSNGTGWPTIRTITLSAFASRRGDRPDPVRDAPSTRSSPGHFFGNTDATDSISTARGRMCCSSGIYVLGPTVRTDRGHRMGAAIPRPEAERFRHDRRSVQAGTSPRPSPWGFTVGASAHDCAGPIYEGNVVFLHPVPFQPRCAT